MEISLRFFCLVLLLCATSCDRIGRRVLTAEFDSRELEALILERAVERVQELENEGSQEIGQWQAWMDNQAYVELACGLMRGYKEEMESSKSISRFADLYSEGGKIWQYVNLTMRMQGVNCVAFGNGKFLASCRRGMFFSSEDGKNWTLREDLRNGEHIVHMTFGVGKFVAVGSKGLLMSSADGRTWEIDRKDPNIGFGSVCFGDAGFVAFGGYEKGEKGFVALSADGVNWEVVERDIAQRVSNVVYGHGRYLATGLCAAAVSPDGLDWDWLTVDDDFRCKFGFYPGVFGNGVMVKIGGQGSILTGSADGEWSVFQSGESGFSNHVAFGLGRFVVHAGSTTWTSQDGLDWRRHEVTGRKGFGGPIAYGSGVFVVFERPDFLGWSADGETWHRHESIVGRISR